MIDCEPYIYALLVDNPGETDVEIVGVQTLQEPKIIAGVSWVSARKFVFSNGVEMGYEIDCSLKHGLCRIIWPMGPFKDEFDLEEFPNFFSDDDVMEWLDYYLGSFF